VIGTRTDGGPELRPEFPVLDTLRAVGALAVLTTHTTFQSGEYGRHGALGTLFSRLDVGVAIFFVLSGFLLSRPYLALAVTRRGRPTTGLYYWKRFLRIYPVYAATALLALGLIDVNRELGGLAWVRTLLLVDIYTVDLLPQAMTQMWSLAVEVMFYLMLPLLMLAAVGRGRSGLQPRRVVAVLVAMTTLSVAWLLGLAEPVGEVTDGVPMTWLPAFLTWFAVGIGLALVHVLHQTRPVPPRSPRALVASVASMPGVCWTVAGGLMLAASTPVAGPAFLFVASPSEALTKHLLYAVIAGLVVATGVFASPEGQYTRVMSTPALRHLGVISYSTFCIHLLVMRLVMSVLDYPLFAGNGLQIWALTLVLSLAASEALYRLVERPGMSLSRVRPPWSRSAASEPTRAAQTTTTR
jgi:peptidoglycan/LPS O-acetylase OafA/YrhL